MNYIVFFFVGSSVRRKMWNVTVSSLYENLTNEKMISEEILLLTASPSNQHVLNKMTPSLFHHVVNVYMMPIIVTLGVIGNSLIVINMHDKAFHRLPLRVYFISLAVYDTLVLTVIGMYQFIRYATGIRYLFTPYLCQFAKFIINLSVSCSYWMIVVIGLDRFLVTSFPLEAKKYSTPSKAKVN